MCAKNALYSHDEKYFLTIYIHSRPGYMALELWNMPQLLCIKVLRSPQAKRTSKYEALTRSGYGCDNKIKLYDFTKLSMSRHNKTTTDNVISHIEIRSNVTTTQYESTQEYYRQRYHMIKIIEDVRTTRNSKENKIMWLMALNNHRITTHQFWISIRSHPSSVLAVTFKCANDGECSRSLVAARKHEWERGML